MNIAETFSEISSINYSNTHSNPMKLDQIPTRRKPVQNTIYARLFNKTKFRKQHASAAVASADDFEEDSGINISRSLSIIFAIHILAIGMIFIHKQYLSGRTEEPKATSNGGQSESVASTRSPERTDEVQSLNTGGKPYMVKKGDNFSVIAAKFNVDEAELRNMNREKEVRAGTVLRIPDAKRIVAVEPPEIQAIRSQNTPHPSENGLVEILPQVARTTVLTQNATNANGSLPAAVPHVGVAKTHIVKPGESVWRISKQYTLTEKELMSVNGISDPTKLKAGQVLRLP